MTKRNDAGSVMVLAATPTAAGTMIMVMVNTFAEFGYNPLKVCLLLSAVFGLSVFAASGAHFSFRRVFLWFVTSVTIFTSAIGTSELGRGASNALAPTVAHAQVYDVNSSTPPPTPVPTPIPTQFFKQWVK